MIMSFLEIHKISTLFLPFSDFKKSMNMEIKDFHSRFFCFILRFSKIPKRFGFIRHHHGSIVEILRPCVLKPLDIAGKIFVARVIVKAYRPYL